MSERKCEREIEPHRRPAASDERDWEPAGRRTREHDRGLAHLLARWRELLSERQCIAVPHLAVGERLTQSGSQWRLADALLLATMCRKRMVNG